MKCNLTQEQMTLTDRIAIETGICHKDSFRKIVLFLHRHPTTISHEVKENRTFLPDIYFLGKDCYFVRKWKEQHIRGDSECTINCWRCRIVDCRTKCPRYRSTACHRFEKPPYVCNTCPEKKLYSKDRFFYSAKHAQASVDRRRSESRKGLSNHGRAASGVRYSADKTGEERTTFDAHLRYTQGRNSGQFNGRYKVWAYPNSPGTYPCSTRWVYPL